MKYYPAIKKECHTDTFSDMDESQTHRGEGSQAPKATSCIIPFILYTQNWHNHRDKSSDPQRLGAGEIWSD